MAKRREAGQIKSTEERRKKPRQERPPLPELGRRFLDWLRLDCYRVQNTVKGYEEDFRSFLAFAGGRELAGFKRQDLRAWVRELGGKFKPATVRRRIAFLRTFYKFIVEEEELRLDNPALGLRRPPPDRTIVDTLTASEADAMILKAGCDRVHHAAELRARDVAVVELLYSCGLRADEVCTLRMDDVNLEAGTLRAHGKGSKDRVVPIAGLSAQALQRYAEGPRARLSRDRDAGTVFLTQNGYPLCRRDIWRIVTHAKEAAGIDKHVHPHTIRHTSATLMLEGGASLPSIQSFLGHAHLSTTGRYLHATQKHLREEYSKAHPRALQSAALAAGGTPPLALPATGGI